MNDHLNNIRLNFGFSEMYEWSEIPTEGISLYGKIVQFDPNCPGKIRLAQNNENIIGITTLNSVIDSDDPDHWQYQYVFNSYGDIFMTPNQYTSCYESYDSELEVKKLNRTINNELIPVQNSQYDDNKTYIKRSERKEWIRVNLLGKCIIEDNGKCVPGKYCTLYSGNEITKFGTAVQWLPWSYNTEIKLYVLKRISDNTVLVLNRNIWG